MWTVTSEAERSLPGLPRRAVLQWGLAAGGLAANASAVPAATATKSNDTAVIFFHMAGGPSHLDTYDLKPTAPAQVRGPFSPIQTTLPGLDICELMPRQVAIAKHLSVIRSITHTLAVHDDASHWVQTGYPLLNARAKGQQNPAEGAVVSRLRGPNQPDVPAYVCVPEDYRSHAGFYQAAAYLGSRFNAVNSGGDPAIGNFRPPEFALPKELHLGRLDNRRELLKRLDVVRADLDQTASGQSLDAVQDQAFHLITSPRVKELFDVTREPDAVRNQYGRHAYGQGALLARRLVEAGVTFVTINLYEKDVDWWDDHYTIEKNLRKRLPVFDQAFSALVTDLRERGLADRVLVAAYGEFGRSPHVDAGGGRGHWPGAMSAVLTGGGIREGQIIGSTTWNGGEPQDRALDPGDLIASVYRVLGIDANTHLPDSQQRPSRLVLQGDPIRELFDDA